MMLMSDRVVVHVKVLKYELYHDSALSRFLLRRALRSKELGHMLYWYLKSEVHVPTIAERYELLLEAYLRGCGSHRAELKKQEDVHVRNHLKNSRNCHLKQSRPPP
jgi:phosphatidylinositol-4,5-bisphosphate 3-kinase